MAPAVQTTSLELDQVLVSFIWIIFVLSTTQSGASDLTNCALRFSMFYLPPKLCGNEDAKWVSQRSWKYLCGGVLLFTVFVPYSESS